jgi:hypothetical protein
VALTNEKSKKKKKNLDHHPLIILVYLIKLSSIALIFQYPSPFFLSSSHYYIAIPPRNSSLFVLCDTFIFPLYWFAITLISHYPIYIHIY